MSPTVAVVDDDAEMLDLLALVLGKSGYEVKTFPTPGRFFDALAKSQPDVCVLDMHLPGMDGRDVIRVLRANAGTKALPIVAISAVARSTADVVQGLELGADEYLAKPVDLDLLVARIAVLLRRAPNGTTQAAETVRYADVVVYPEEHRVTVGGKDVALTHLELKLLLYFLKNPNRVLTRGLMLEKVWGTGPDLSTRTVDKHVEALRKKLPAFGARVETVIRVGYLFRP